MSHESHTTINVAKLGAERARARFSAGYEHFFRVQINSHPEFPEVVNVLRELMAKFPEPQYQIDVTYWECRGFPVKTK